LNKASLNTLAPVWYLKLGDKVRFKDIANAASTPMSSRFIQKENVLSMESVYVGYEFYEVARILPSFVQSPFILVFIQTADGNILDFVEQGFVVSELPRSNPNGELSIRSHAASN